MTNSDTIRSLIEGGDWFRLQHDAEAREASVHIYGTIGNSEWWDDVASPSLVRELDALDVDRISLYVNSPGGLVDDGVAIMNALARNKAHTTAHIDGLAASAATIVILGADEIVMGAGSRMMIHDAWSIAWGQASELQKTVERLEKLSQTLAGLYAQRAGGEVDDWRAAMLAETWYTPDEAVEAGLADRVAELSSPAAEGVQNVVSIADAARVFGWRHAGREAAAAPFIPARAGVPVRASVLPSSTEPGDIREQKEASEVDDTFKTGVRERLGVTDATADDEMLLAALDEALAETVDTPTVPEGVVMMDAGQLEQLRADAQAGREARAQQEKERRDALVQSALADGRISAASQAAWREQLDRDEAGASMLLASLVPNTVPVVELGHADADLSSDDALYARAFGVEKEEVA